MIKLILTTTVLLVGLGFVSYNFTSSYFTAQATVDGIKLGSAESFVTPTISPTVTPTPTPIPGGNLCGSINVDISGNGSGSVNSVFIICQNWKVVYQSNNTNVNTQINIDSTTGSNTNSGNTNGQNSTTSGDTNSTVNVNVSGSTNSSSTTQTSSSSTVLETEN